VLSIVSTYALMRLVFRGQLSGGVEDHIEAPLSSDGKLVLGGMGLTAAVLLAASSMGHDLGLPTCLAAVAVTAAASIKARHHPLGLVKAISWETIALVAGLFILVDAVQSIGALQFAPAALAWAERLAAAPGALVTGFVVGVANNLINNLPLGLIAGEALKASHATRLIASSVLIGVDLGPNLSVSGSLATILWLIALRKEKLDVSYWGFLKVGVVLMPAALFAALCGTVVIAAMAGSHSFRSNSGGGVVLSRQAGRRAFCPADVAQIPGSPVGGLLANEEPQRFHVGCDRRRAPHADVRLSISVNDGVVGKGKRGIGSSFEVEDDDLVAAAF
jgi:Arsenical pump membrane protein